MAQQLNAATLRILGDRWAALAEHRCDFPDDAAEWDAVFDGIGAIMRNDTVETMKQHPEVHRELYHCLDAGDFYTRSGARTSQAKRALADLCRVGFFDKHDPNAVQWSSKGGNGKPRTMVVDGVRYECE